MAQIGTIWPILNIPTKYPKNLTHLTFCCKFNQSIDDISDSITHLKLAGLFNQPINKLPKSLTHLFIGSDFSKSLNVIFNKNLTCGYNTFVKIIQTCTDKKKLKLTNFHINFYYSLEVDTIIKNSSYSRDCARVGENKCNKAMYLYSELEYRTNVMCLLNKSQKNKILQLYCDKKFFEFENEMMEVLKKKSSDCTIDFNII